MVLTNSLNSKLYRTDIYLAYACWQIPKGTQSHSRICLNGKGIKRINTYGYGDHYVHVKIRIPTKLSAEQEALLTALAELETDTPGTINGITYTKDGKLVQSLHCRTKALVIAQRQEFSLPLFLLFLSWFASYIECSLFSFYSSSPTSFVYKLHWYDTWHTCFGADLKAGNEV